MVVNNNNDVDGFHNMNLVSYSIFTKKIVIILYCYYNLVLSKETYSKEVCVDISALIINSFNFSSKSNYQFPGLPINASAGILFLSAQLLEESYTANKLINSTFDYLFH